MSIVVSIDIGYINMGFVEAYISSDRTITILNAVKLNLSKHQHNRVSRDVCTIPHTREIVDGVSHFIQEYRDVLDNCNVLLIERQPPSGFTSIEGILFREFRSKAILISPNAMHRFLGINNLDYDARKAKTVEFAKDYIDLKTMERKHDISDAICMIIFYNNPYKEEYESNKLPFENFKFVDSKCGIIEQHGESTPGI